MTISPVPSAPAHTELQTYDVDKSITGRHMADLINNTSFLVGKNVENVVCSYPAVAQLANAAFPDPEDIVYHSVDYDWFYTRSPGVNFVVLETELHRSTFRPIDLIAYDTITSASLPVGASYVNEDSQIAFVNNRMGQQWTGTLDFSSTRTGVINVSALSTTVPSLFSIRVTGISGTYNGTFQYRPGGISKLLMQELPQNFLTVSGIGQSGSSDIISVLPFRRVVDGSADTEFGLARMLDQTKKVRSTVRNQWQIVNHKSAVIINNPPTYSGIPVNSTTIWQCSTSAESDLLFRLPGLAQNVFYIRTRNYDGYTGAQTNKYTLYVRYRTELAAPASGCFIRLNFISEPNAHAGTATVPLPASLTWATANINLDLPCDEWIFMREQINRLNFTAGGAGSGQVIYVSALYLVENE
jgi:hypothetical protein